MTREGNHLIIFRLSCQSDDVIMDPSSIYLPTVNVEINLQPSVEDWRGGGKERVSTVQRRWLNHRHHVWSSPRANSSARQRTRGIYLLLLDVSQRGGGGEIVAGVLGVELLMARNFSCYLLIVSLVLTSVPHSVQLQSSQAWSLLQLQRLLSNPVVSTSWSSDTDFCNAEPNSSVTVVCYEESVTQLHINGNLSSPALPKSFSIDSFFTTLTRLPDLKVLSLTSLGLWGSIPAKISRLSSLEIVNMSSNFLSGNLPEEISRLKNLQTLILDHNVIGGRVPDWISSFPLMAVLSLKNNTFDGPLPNSLSSMESLRVLVLSYNKFYGQLPDLSGLSDLQVLDLDNNKFGPEFPRLGKKIVTLLMRNNSFTGGLPPGLTSEYLLQQLDVSSNRFVGPFMPALFSLFSIRYLNISGNRFTGMLFTNISCNVDLKDVDLSSNLLTGALPTCLSSKSLDKKVSYSGNCLANKDQFQHPNSFCQNQAFAVGLLPHKQKKASAHKAIVVVSVVLAVVGALVVALLLFSAIRRAKTRRTVKRPPRRLIEHASNGYPSKLLADARYISQTMKLGALGIPPYRSFSLDELEAATNNFDTSAFMGEGSLGQMYKGTLRDGSPIAIRCLKLKRSHSSQNFNRHIELISKLRHRHLVSALGHCFEYYLEDSSVSTLFLIFEYVSNGTLRSNILGQKLSWTQRIAAAIGVAKGIQFLHAGIIPGLFANDLKITNVLLDHNLVAKISSYNLPLIAGGSAGSKEHRRTLPEGKLDIYDFGVILLEIMSGRPVSSRSDAEILKDQLDESVTADGMARRRNIIDPVIWKTCCNESVKTAIEICIRCLSQEPSGRPSVEDVLWNLQFAAQVQDAWRGDSNSSEDSPLSQTPALRSSLD
ncbi:putative inactive leucine-rich repeat receptor-like protein kinase [Apostasia shenzhenica]|uniref:Putative inactive leucine-rich repeat receptor-like protein kinase n=1 Tax=Apostasia shenzhenica TaxID=1088818 RepID=A0A2I0BE59_9ASPA|nr:putative inactive leucine-rich repeat receptor-like protein kinase [Apostasia shenzhenica]